MYCRVDVLFGIDSQAVKEFRPVEAAEATSHEASISTEKSSDIVNVSIEKAVPLIQQDLLDSMQRKLSGHHESPNLVS